MRCVPAGLEALLGRAGLVCHRWSTSVSVGASAAHPRAPPVLAADTSPSETYTRALHAAPPN